MRKPNGMPLDFQVNRNRHRPSWEKEFTMPLVRVTLLKGKSSEYLKAVSTGIYDALVKSYAMPENDHFQIFEQKEPTELLFDRNFQTQTPRSDNFMILNIKADARRVAEKEALYANIVENLAKSPGINPQDVFLSLDVNTYLEDWSFGNGISAAKGF
jgi:4-oxalocrotonate tautomerase